MKCEYFFIKILKFYPKRFGSLVVGWIVSFELPVFFRVYLLSKFVKAYKIDMTEAELPLEEYPSLQALFSRRLRIGVRTQSAAVPGVVNSPVDGSIIACGRITAGLAVQAKGLSYRIEELLKHDIYARRFEGGHYLTIYLSPKDYHHVHVPIFGNVKTVSKVDGELWPVNDVTTRRVFHLYERNRRVVWTADGSGFDEGLEVAIVLVGATHVGNITIDKRWLSGQQLPKDGIISSGGQRCQIGEELGAFQLGSTVILLIGGSRAAEWETNICDGTVSVGQKLGNFI